MKGNCLDMVKLQAPERQGLRDNKQQKEAIFLPFHQTSSRATKRFYNLSLSLSAPSPQTKAMFTLLAVPPN